MGKRVGIKDVAAAADVSVTTVSHILNNVEGKRINPETRQRVLEAARRLGYAPNGLARGLRLKRSNTVGFVSDEIATTPYAGRIILGAQEAAAEQGLLLLMLNTGGNPELERKEIDLLLQRQVDGVLYASMFHRVVEVPDGLRSVPTVLLDARSDDLTVPSVVPDEVLGGYTAVRELLDHGHRRIGFVNNLDDIPATHGRLKGYRAALAEAAIADDPDLVVTETADSAGGYRAARRLLEGGAAHRVVLLQRQDGDGRLPGGCRAGAVHPGGPVGHRIRQPGADLRGRVPQADHGRPAALRDGGTGDHPVARPHRSTGPDRGPGRARDAALPARGTGFGRSAAPTLTSGRRSTTETSGRHHRPPGTVWLDRAQ